MPKKKVKPKKKGKAVNFLRWSWEPSAAGKGANVQLDGPRVARQREDDGDEGHSVRTRAPLPMSGRVYWEVVFAYPGEEKGAGMGSGYVFGVVDGTATAEQYGREDGIYDNEKWWGLEDIGGIFRGADQAKIMIFTVNAFNNFGKVLDKTTPLKKLF